MNSFAIRSNFVIHISHHHQFLSPYGFSEMLPLPPVGGQSLQFIPCFSRLLRLSFSILLFWEVLGHPCFWISLEFYSSPVSSVDLVGFMSVSDPFSPLSLTRAYWLLICGFLQYFIWNILWPDSYQYCHVVGL